MLENDSISAYSAWIGNLIRGSIYTWKRLGVKASHYAALVEKELSLVTSVIELWCTLVLM